jgi:hypothetical protein
MVPLVVVQFNASEGPAETLGVVVLLLTITVDVLEHNVAGSVIVTVYVPAAFTVAEAVPPPDTIPGPPQL